jgi:hypothetical protein
VGSQATVILLPASWSTCWSGMAARERLALGTMEPGGIWFDTYLPAPGSQHDQPGGAKNSRAMLSGSRNDTPEP